MEAYLYRNRKLVYLLLGSLLSLGVIVFLQGCAAGRGDAGELVVGFKVGQLTETAGQALNLAAGMLPAPWGSIASIVIASLTGLSGSYLTAKSRDKADALYDEGYARGLLTVGAQALVAKPAPINGYSQPDPTGPAATPFGLVPPQVV